MSKIDLHKTRIYFRRLHAVVLAHLTDGSATTADEHRDNWSEESRKLETQSHLTEMKFSLIEFSEKIFVPQDFSQGAWLSRKSSQEMITQLAS